MAACRRIVYFPQKRHFYLYKSVSRYQSNANTAQKTSQKEIVVPYRIERSPTDILKALASTISRDPTAAHYKYEDDPYLMPASNITKRSFALSKESGRKAARYFLENYPDVFLCNTSVPHIKAFDPPIRYTENDDVSEDILKDCIVNNDVQNCIDVFNILKKKAVTISQEVKQDLLELLSFYNNSPPPLEDYYEERYFRRNDESFIQKWDAKGLAEQLFDSMEKDGRAYSSMIAGLAKYRNAERALLLHDEMKSKGLVGTVYAYNCLLSECHLIQGDFQSFWELALNLLHHMNQDGLKPDIYTMNSLLRLLSKALRWKKSKTYSLQVLNEMKQLEIEPSLGSYYYLMMIFASSEFGGSGILYEIMDLVDNKEHTVKHPTDVNFFASAMELCYRELQDKDLGYRIHELLEHENNCKLLGNALSENHYFKYFFRLLCETEDLDKMMELYDKYVPNIYTPEPAVTLAVLQAVHFNGAYKYLPKLCSDVLLFEQTERTNILETLLDAAACMKHEDEIQKPLIDMVWNIVEKINIRSKGRRMNFEWTGTMFGNIMRTFINGKDLEKSWCMMQQINSDQNAVIVSPEKEVLLDYCQLCIEVEDYDKMNFCIKYAVNGNFPDFRDNLVKRVDDLFEEKILDEKHRDQIKTFLRVSGSGMVSEDSSSSDTSSSESSNDSDSSSDEEVEKSKTDV